MKQLINSGTYAIVFYLMEDNEFIIPRFGRVFFRKGYYVYSGSAKKNLIPRVKRHIRKEKKLKWHIDYFSVSEKVITKKIFLFAHRSECEINRFFKLSGGKIVIEKFGASDCKNKCKSHFLYFEKMPKLKTVIEFGGIDGKLLILQNIEQTA
jgi:Uri superfamily endonuclease